tara:strand:- start:872 stop:2050 length:1179 start_codon:yes stop_codon:yes gene_type:complete
MINNLKGRRKILKYIIIYLFIFIVIDFSIGSIRNPKIPGVYHPYYHHDIKAMFSGKLRWGNEYPMYTNSLGFKDRINREISLQSDKYRILFIGDSITEGVGVPYTETFVGVIENRVDLEKVELLNAGVISYSPKLYYLKIKYLLEILGLKIDEIIVFIDISDIQDELVYESFISKENNKGKAIIRDVDSLLKENSITYYFFRNTVFCRNCKILKYMRGEVKKFYNKIKSLFDNINEFKNLDSTTIVERGNNFDFNTIYENDNKSRYSWTDNKAIYNNWGRRGMMLAQTNMKKLTDLCKINGIRLNIVIYPWPYQIQKRDLNGLHVSEWTKFSENNGIKLLNLFPLFINDKPVDLILANYFIEGDVHWNRLGHKLIANSLFDKFFLKYRMDDN